MARVKANDAIMFDHCYWPTLPQGLLKQGDILINRALETKENPSRLQLSIVAKLHQSYGQILRFQSLRVVDYNKQLSECRTFQSDEILLPIHISLLPREKIDINVLLTCEREIWRVAGKHIMMLEDPSYGRIDTVAENISNRSEKLSRVCAKTNSHSRSQPALCDDYFNRL